MWQRYLVGNFSFLARVMGQRFSLRKKAPVIPVPEISLPAEEPEAPRLPDVIIIATSATRRDFPVPEDFPSGLLPIGTATVIEHLITALASTKFREIDMVVSLRPEAFRKVLGDGERWGVHINWVLAKDPDRPYEAIRGRYPRVDTRLLVGHCDLWLATDALEAMQAQEGMSVFLGDGDAIEWTGWANISASELLDIPSHVTRSEFEDFIAKRNPSQLVLYDSQCACLRSPAKLLKAQSLALHQQTQCAAPSTWIRHDWGAICPTAFLSPNARVIAPVLIGPGCMVMAGATVGPNAVLTRDVIVGYGTCVNDSLVLAKTLLGAEMDVSNSIVQGNLVQNLALNVRTAMHQTDGLLLDLKRVDSLFVALLARLVAFMVLVTLSPVVLLLLAIRRLLGSTLPWQHQSIVVGRDLVRKNLKMTSLRCARLSSPILGCFGELIDVGLGRRNWFGIRARSAPEWYALSPEWQQLMSNAPIGLFNQVCWNDGLDQESEFAAAADALFIAREGTQERFKIFMANCKRLFRAQ